MFAQGFHTSRNTIACLLLMWILTPAMLLGQTAVQTSSGRWVHLGIRLELSKRWFVQSTNYMREDEQFKHVQQFISHLQLHRKVGDKVVLGMAVVSNHLYKETTEAVHHMGEHRLWEELLWTAPLNLGKLHHRVRLEHRWLQLNPTDAQKLYLTRVRLRLEWQVPLHTSGARHALHGYVGNEVFLQMGPHAPQPFDRNRAWLSVGYGCNSKCEVRLGYVHQYSAPNATQYHSLHAVHAQVVLSLALPKPKPNVAD